MAIRLWTVALGGHASDHVSIDVDSECFVDLLRASLEAEAGDMLSSTYSAFRCLALNCAAFMRWLHGLVRAGSAP
jgi:hypothetical protein